MTTLTNKQRRALARALTPPSTPSNGAENHLDIPSIETDAKIGNAMAEIGNKLDADAKLDAENKPDAEGPSNNGGPTEPPPLAPRLLTYAEQAQQILDAKRREWLAMEASLTAAVVIAAPTDAVYLAITYGLAHHADESMVGTEIGKLFANLATIMAQVKVNINIDLHYDCTTKQLMVGRDTPRRTVASGNGVATGHTDNTSRTPSETFATIAKDGKSVDVVKRGNLMDCPKTENIIKAVFGVDLKLTGQSTDARKKLLSAKGFTYTMA